MTVAIEKGSIHVGVRFYRVQGVEIVLVPLLDEVSSFVRMAGDGYFLVVLAGPPGTAYPLNLRAKASFDPGYLESKFSLSRGGTGYSGEEIAATLLSIADDLEEEKVLDS
ncbi:MAG TPA: hypothetical protein QGF35_06280 [Dehalococcoidia bacterium]|jgi:hypothetical protein|nr:hypothetical protein [Dehalococcoidia bacterium]